MPVIFVKTTYKIFIVVSIQILCCVGGFSQTFKLLDISKPDIRRNINVKLKKEGYYFLPAKKVVFQDNIVIDGWNNGVLMGAGRGFGGTTLQFAPGKGLIIRNCKKLVICNLNIKTVLKNEKQKAVSIQGDISGNLAFINVFISACNSLALQKYLGGPAYAIEAPVDVLLQNCHILHADPGILLNHPKAKLTVLGGNSQDTSYHLFQKQGWFQVYGVGFQLAHDKADIVIREPSISPFLITACRTEGPGALLKIPESTEKIDVIVKSCSVATQKDFKGCIQYNAAGQCVLLGNNSRSFLKADKSSGTIWSLACLYFGKYKKRIPYAIGEKTKLFYCGDLWRTFSPAKGYREPLFQRIKPDVLNDKSFIFPVWNVASVKSSVLLNREDSQPVEDDLIDGLFDDLSDKKSSLSSKKELKKKKLLANIKYVKQSDVFPVLPESKKMPFMDMPVPDNISDLIVSVKKFGAKGDGKSDDTEALQKALDSNRHGSLFFPKGIYMLSRPLFIDHRFGGSLIGEGKGTTLKNPTGTVIASDGCGYANFMNLNFESGNSKKGIAFDLSWNWPKDKKEGMPDGFSGAALQGNSFYNCTFKSAAIGLAIGSKGYMGSESWIMNCEFSNCGIGVKTCNFNALSNNMVNCEFVSNGIGVYQGAGSFNLFSSCFRQSKTADMQCRNSAWDCFYIRNCTSNSARLLTVAHTGADINVIFENLKLSNNDSKYLVWYRGGGVVIFINSIVPDRKKILLGGSISNNSLIYIDRNKLRQIR